MGPDGLPGLILQYFSYELSYPLSIIFNTSLSEGTVHNDWRCAEVTAIFKKGDKSSPGNYRPVSLTSVICKVLESFIREQLVLFMEGNNMFSSCQHGFKSHRSCVTQLLDVMNDLTELIENGDSIDVLYLDFRKAFDTVPHQRLSNKLKAYGIDGNLLNWIQSFLSGRKQRVKVNNSDSDYSQVKNGIPQGSILGPVLFIIFINDLPDLTQNICKIFADDTKIYGSDDKFVSIQDDLFKLMQWSNTWQLHFNTDKCSVLHMGKKNKQHTYFMDEDRTKELKTIQSEKDVGVTFSTNMKFDLHISNIINKANKLTGLIKRSFNHLDKNKLVMLYKSIVRPHLEYANVIWHPAFKRQRKNLEKVQRRATKIVSEFRDMSYEERLKALNLPSIKYRQLRGDLIQTYKIIHNIDNVDTDKLFKFQTSSNTRNSEFKLFKEFAKTKTRSNFLTYRINNILNSLSVQTRTAKNVNNFKTLVDIDLTGLRFDYD